jgi:hypothetical protein
MLAACVQCNKLGILIVSKTVGVLPTFWSAVAWHRFVIAQALQTENTKAVPRHRTPNGWQRPYRFGSTGILTDSDVKNQLCNREVDDQAGGIHQRGDQWRREHCRIDSETFGSDWD